MYLGYIKNAIYSDSHNFPYSGFTCKKNLVSTGNNNINIMLGFFS